MPSLDMGIAESEATAENVPLNSAASFEEWHDNDKGGPADISRMYDEIEKAHGECVYGWPESQLRATQRKWYKENILREAA